MAQKRKIECFVRPHPADTEHEKKKSRVSTWIPQVFVRINGFGLPVRQRWALKRASSCGSGSLSIFSRNVAWQWIMKHSPDSIRVEH